MAVELFPVKTLFAAKVDVTRGNASLRSPESL
jgi:hypothetical protein